MSGKISESVVNLAKRVDNLEQQRSLVSDTVDRYNVFFVTFKPIEDTPKFISTLTESDTRAITDDFKTPESGKDFEDEFLNVGAYGLTGYGRVDYAISDYDRASHYRGGATSNVKMFIGGTES